MLGGVPKTVLADRMGCLKLGWCQHGGADPDYVRFATHYGVRTDFCEAADPESKGMWRTWSATPTGPDGPAATFDDLRGQRRGRRVVRGRERCTHSEIPRCPPTGWRPSCRCSVRAALGLELGARPVLRKVDRLSCVRFVSARYSVPCRLIGQQVTPSPPRPPTNHNDRAGDRGSAWPNTASSRPVRPSIPRRPLRRSRGRTGPAGCPCPEPRPRGTSSHWGRSRKRSSSAPPQPGCPGSAPNWPR